MIRVTFEIPDRDPKQDGSFTEPWNDNHQRVINYVRESYLREISSAWVIEYTED